MPQRRTKIVATLGPATSHPDVIESMVLAGMDVARLNFSHGNADEHRERCQTVRRLAEKHGRHIAIMGDLQGPKIRIARFKDTRIELTDGQSFTLSNTFDKSAGTKSIVGIDYPSLVADCAPGDELLLDDGRIVLKVERVDSDAVH